MAIAAAGLLLGACANERGGGVGGQSRLCGSGILAGTGFGADREREGGSRPRGEACIVLLGEVHDDADHHRWQLQALSTLHGRGRPLVIGVEMLPRRAQPALDQWVAGSLSETEFLRTVRWDETWGHDPALYLPLFASPGTTAFPCWP